MIMIKLNHLLPIFLLVLFVACDKDNDMNPQPGGDIDCESLSMALISEDDDDLEAILTPILDTIVLQDLDNNACVHDESLKAFAELLTEECANLTATVLCCGCIETLPLISEVAVTVDSAGTEVVRILDLETPNVNGAPLSYRGVHR